jgi:hypothetical protein
MPLSECEELRQVAEKAIEAWRALDVSIDLETAQRELEWMELVEKMFALGAVLHSQAKKNQT